MVRLRGAGWRAVVCMAVAWFSGLPEIERVVAAAPINSPSAPYGARALADVGDQGAYYYWCDSEHLLILEPASPPGHFRAVMLDIRSGGREPLTRVNSRLSAFRGVRTVMYRSSRDGSEQAEVRYEPLGFAVSPDGRRLIWPIGTYGDNAGWTGADLTGQPMPVWRPLRAEPVQYYVDLPVWMPDGRSWVLTQVEYDKARSTMKTKRAVFWSVASGRAQRTVSLDALEETVPVAALGEDRLLFRQDEPRGDRNAILLYELATVADSVRARRCRVVFPDEVVLLGQPSCGRRGRLVWVVSHQPRLDGPLLPTKASMWTSRADGSDMRQLKVRPQSGRDEIYLPWVPLQVQWTPDGRHVTFLHGTTVLVAPDPANGTVLRWGAVVLIVVTGLLGITWRGLASRGRAKR